MAFPADQKVIEATIRVRFAETDMMGIVHHGAYIVYFEEGRSEYSRQVGAPYAELEDSGHSLAVSEVRARYIAPARYDDVLKIRTWVKKIGSRGVTFGYEIIQLESGQTLVRGESHHICVDHNGQVKHIPEPWLSKLREGAGLL